MDVPFYEDEIMPIDSSTENTMYDKSAMKLDLNSAVRFQNGFVDNSILTSPDLNLLKLASPELEKLILNSASLVTPTPQGYKNNNNQNLTVTEQQELYARGFLEALQKLHQEQGPPGEPTTNTYTQNPPTCTVGMPSRPIVTQATMPMNVSTMPIQQQMVVNSSASLNTAPSYPSNTLSTISTESLPLESVNVGVTSQIFPQFQNAGITLSAPSNILNGVTNYTFSNQSRMGEMKFEDSLQVVPNGTPPLPPIDLELQEAVKSERKRQRNRMAASKCRRRKLEKEAELEKKVSDLKATNSDLLNEALELRKQICQLKEQVMKHISGGCKVNFSST
jgi:hypothetical protein